MALKGCWTCKERRVACDRTYPQCSRCTKAKRQCGGYGMRLVWPKEDCNRASVNSFFTKPEHLVDGDGTFHWVNIVPTDVRLHLVSSASMGNGRRATIRQLVVPNLPELISLKPMTEKAGDMELIRYFEVVMIDLLPMLGTDRARLGRLILESALSSNKTRSSNAVLHAVLALASYHRGDNTLEVDRYKRTALRGLFDHVDLDMCQATEHVAANVILCVLEMQQTSHNNSAWVGYISGVKQVIDAFNTNIPPVDSDASIMLGWVYHFDVMARFSFRHWRTEQMKALAKELGFSPDGETCIVQYLLARASFLQGVSSISSHAHPVLQLLAEVSTIAMYSSEPNYLTAEYQRHLNDLHSRLENVEPRISGRHSSLPNDVIHTQQLLELARLAGLIYLSRVSRNFSGRSPQIDSWTRLALDILATLHSCLSPFALFIIGCEVDRDEDRMVLLDLYAKMEAKLHLQSFMETRALTQTAWNQQDLAEDGKLEYIHKLNLVMSSRGVVPCLA